MTDADRRIVEPGPAPSLGPAAALVGLRAAAWERVAHPIWICDVATERVVAANGAALALLGLADDTLHKVELAALEAEGGGALRSAAHRAVDEGGVAVRARLHDAHGNQPISVAGSATALEHDGRRYACFAVRRLDEPTPADEDLAQSQRLESIGLLAGGIAHDFNNLLTGVLGQVSLALAVLPDGSEARAPMNKAAAAAGRAAELTRQLLAYAGKGQFQIESIGVNELIIENIGLFETMLPKGVRLNLELDPDLSTISADRSQIQQVLMNLVLNAAEATAESGGTVTVETRPRDGTDDVGCTFVGGTRPAPGKHVMIVVTDTGAGMCAETLSRIFDPFFSTKGSGRGLGLSATLGIMRTHRGGLAVTSGEGEGTSFCVLLPSEPRRTAEPQDEVRAEAPQAMQSQVRVLIVDDEPAVREATTDMLELAGMSVVTAVNGREGVQHFEGHGDTIDLVLLDVKMPVMDGPEALRELRALDEHVKVILMSGYNESEATRQFGGDGPTDFLQKPFDYETLLTKVGDALA